MPFLPPNQQRPSTEGALSQFKISTIKVVHYTLTPLPLDKIFKIYSHMSNTWVHLPEIAVTELERIISGYTAT